MDRDVSRRAGIKTIPEASTSSRALFIEHNGIQGCLKTPCYTRSMVDSSDLKSISDDDLLRWLADLSKESRRVESDLVAHIAEVDERRLYAREACSSMFVYCQEVLHLAEHEAYLRIAAARVARRYPWFSRCCGILGCTSAGSRSWRSISLTRITKKSWHEPCTSQSARSRSSRPSWSQSRTYPQPCAGFRSVPLRSLEVYLVQTE